MIRHHPPLDLLFDYATGSLPEAVALTIAVHLENCPECRKTVGQIESVGGALLETLPPVEIADHSLDSVLARLDEPPAAQRQTARVASVPQEPFVPRVMRPYLKGALENLPWRRIGGLFEEALLPISGAAQRVSIVRARNGGFVPMHGHGGPEYLAVLSGGLRSNGETLERGDYAYSNASDFHEPVVDAYDECVCLLVLEAPLKFSGSYGETLDPLYQM